MKLAEKNFWGFVEIINGACWPWKGCKVGKYNQARCSRVRGEQIAARAMWRIVSGEIPNGLCVLHTCDDESCVNPDHLFLGTRKDNNLDKLKKGRQWKPKGQANPYAKLTEEKVRQIRALRASGHLQQEIAEIIGCSRSNVSNVLNRAWRHVT